MVARTDIPEKQVECPGAPGGWRSRSNDVLVYDGERRRPHHAAHTRSRSNTGARRERSYPGRNSRRRTVAAIQRDDDVAVVIRHFANEVRVRAMGRMN